MSYGQHLKSISKRNKDRRIMTNQAGEKITHSGWPYYLDWKLYLNQKLKQLMNLLLKMNNGVAHNNMSFFPKIC